MKTLLAIPLIIAIIIVGGKFFLEYQYKKKLDALIQQASLFVNARYDKVFIDMQGAINVSNINIADKFGNNLRLQVDNLRLFSSDRTMLVKGFEGIQQGQIPEVLEVSAKNIKFDTALLQTIDPVRECRYIEEPLDYKKFINSDFTSNFVINLTSESANEFSMSSDVFVHGISDTSVDLTFEKSLLNSNVTSVMTQEVPLRSFRFKNENNPVYSQKFIEYCANKLNLSKEQYVTDIIGGNEYYKALKLNPSFELKEALIKHFSGEGSLTIYGKPSSTARQDLQRLHLFSPDQIIQLLNLKVLSNGQEITNLIDDSPVDSLITEQLNDADETQVPQETTPVAEVPNADSIAPAKRPSFSRKSFTYETVNNNELSNYIYKKVKVYRRGRVLEGELLEANANSIRINNKSFGGSTIMNLSFDEITKVEVKFFKQD